MWFLLCVRVLGLGVACGKTPGKLHAEDGGLEPLRISSGPEGLCMHASLSLVAVPPTVRD